MNASAELLKELRIDRKAPLSKFYSEESIASLGEGVELRWEEKARAQIARELDLIDKLDLAGYFLIVWDFVKFAKDRGILVGPGLGKLPQANLALISVPGDYAGAERWLAYLVTRDDQESRATRDTLPRYDFMPDGNSLIVPVGEYVIDWKQLPSRRRARINP